MEVSDVPAPSMMALPHVRAAVIIAAVRPIVVAIVMMVVGFAVAIAVPRWVAVGAMVVFGGAMVGSLRTEGWTWSSGARSILLACATFGYPLFLGGRMLPWVALLAHVGLLVAGWYAPPTLRGRIATAQALAIALAVSLSAAATQFFFPLLWRWVAAAAVAVFLVLICATLPGSVINRFPSPAVAATVLVLSEGLVILHQLPTHWAINGAIIALAFAALLEHQRIPRTTFAALLIAVLLFGVFHTS